MDKRRGDLIATADRMLAEMTGGEELANAQDAVARWIDQETDRRDTLDS